jgi:hypothetical protein
MKRTSMKNVDAKPPQSRKGKQLVSEEPPEFSDLKVNVEEDPEKIKKLKFGLFQLFSTVFEFEL